PRFGRGPAEPPATASTPPPCAISSEACAGRAAGPRSLRGRGSGRLSRQAARIAPARTPRWPLGDTVTGSGGDAGWPSPGALLSTTPPLVALTRPLAGSYDGAARGDEWPRHEPHARDPGVPGEDPRPVPARADVAP